MTSETIVYSVSGDWNDAFGAKQIEEITDESLLFCPVPRRDDANSTLDGPALLKVPHLEQESCFRSVVLQKGLILLPNEMYLLHLNSPHIELENHLRSVVLQKVLVLLPNRMDLPHLNSTILTGEKITARGGVGGRHAKT